MNAVEKCPRTEALSALVDKELEECERLALEAHVAGCALCAPVLAGFEQLRSGFAALSEPVPGVDIAQLVDRRIAAGAGAARQKPRARPQRWHWWQVAPAALGGALSLALGAYLGGALILGSPLAVQPAALQMAAFAATPPGALCPVLQSCKFTGR